MIGTTPARRRIIYSADKGLCPLLVPENKKENTMNLAMPANLAGIVANVADRYPDQVALLDEHGAAWTYPELQRKSEAVTTGLSLAADVRGRRVAVVLPDGPELVAVFLGVSAQSACAPLNPAFRQSEYEFYLGDLGPAAMIAPVDSIAAEAARAREIPVLDPATLLSGDVNPNHGPVEFKDTALVLHTSGTTSRPKLVELSQLNLLTSARNIAMSLQLHAEDRCLGIMPLFHIHGLVAEVLASLHAGASIICTPGLNPERFTHWVRELKPSWYTGVPTMHQAAMKVWQRESGGETSGLRLIRSSSAPLPPTLLQSLESAFACPVVEAYGMTEAAHQITSNPIEPGERRPGSVGRAAGPELAIMDEAGELLPRGETGEVIIRGDNVTPGYADNPDANSEAFADGWFRTGDQGHLDRDGYLWLSGRLKEIINRGGETIAPREIDEALLRHPAVATAVAFAVPHPTLGEDIAAAVVLAGPATAQELREFAFGELVPAKVPSRIIIVDEIPKGPTGKLQRIGLDEKLVDALATPFRETGSVVEKTIARVFGKLLDVPRVGASDNFFSLGGDSLSGLRAISSINKQLNCALTAEQLFQSPTPAELASRIEGAISAKTSTVIKRPNGEWPASSSQQHMWLLNEIGGAGGLYNIAFAIHISGYLDGIAMNQAVEALSIRQKTLRTTLSVADERLIQNVVDQPLELEVDDLSNMAEPAAAIELQRRLRRDASEGFELDRELPVRFRLYRMSEAQHVLSMTAHHCAFDGVLSLEILCRELSTLYRQEAGQAVEELAPLGLDYTDWALKRHGILESRQSRNLAYWTQRLAEIPVLKLPTDFPRPAVQDTRGGHIRRELPKELLSSLASWGQREGLTLFPMALAAFKALLYRYSGQMDFAVGVPTAGRNIPGSENLIGYFINTLAIRTQIDPDMPFTRLVELVREELLQDMAHQDVAFENLVKTLQPARSRDHSPIFQVMFAQHDRRHTNLDLPGCECRVERTSTGTAKFDLTVSILQEQGRVSVTAEYSLGLFREETIARLLEHYLILLQSAVQAPDTAVANLNLMSEEHERELVDMGTGLVRPEFPMTAAHERVRQIAERTPQSTALIQGGDWLTFEELQTRVERVASWLHQQNVARGEPVAVCMDWSQDLAVAALAILESGCAYLPLEPGQPETRSMEMVTDAGVRIVFGNEDHCHWVPAGIESQDPAELARDENLDHEHRETTETFPDQLAYIIYTSGSTGKPKGVMVEHGALANHVSASLERFPNQPGDRLLQLASPAFDASVAGMLCTLAGGGTLCLPDRQDAIAGAELAEVIRRLRITSLGLTPTLLASLSGEDLWSVHTLFVGGEILSTSLAREFAKGRRLINCYGPTETTVNVTWGVPDPETGHVTLGRPMPNNQVFVLDRTMQLTPRGVPGELCIAGAQVARGYLGRDELTATRFVPCPWAEEPDTRMYRTGDLVRFLPNGELEFLGRIDEQMKIRGYRVEPGEIEAALCEHARVAEAAVIRHEDTLVAYACVRPPMPADERLLISHLKKTLPGWMVPGRVITLDEMPRTVTGKLDRKSLVLPESVVPEPTGIPPRTETEKELVSLWKELLRSDKVGVHDSFFDLGGHSLLASRAVNFIRKKFGIQVGLAQIFDFPTPAAMAAHIETAR